MRKMKDSGIEWIGKIPKVLNIHRNKYLIRYEKGRKPIHTNIDKIGMPYIGASDLDDILGKCQYSTFTTDTDMIQCDHDDVLILWDGARAGLIGTNHKGAISSTIINAIPNNTINKRFWYWYLKGFEKYLYDCVNGTTIPHMSRKYIEDIQMLSWSYDKQTLIADFLDNKCAKIDRYIEKQQQIIEKLKEYKRVIITEAVTKGLDHDVKMKDSGIEWIGEVPQKWNLSHIGNLAEIGSGGTPDRNKPEYWEEGTIPWMTSGEINYESIYDTYEKITELGMKNSNAKLLPINTVMLGLIGQGKTKGLTAITKVECTCNQNLAYLKSNPSFLHYQYLFYCFKSMYNYIRGLVGESQAGIYQYFLKKQYIPLPSINEQIKISSYLNNKCEIIDVKISKIQSIISKLVEYKRSLIYEAVTGKMEV